MRRSLILLVMTTLLAGCKPGTEPTPRPVKAPSEKSVDNSTGLSSDSSDTQRTDETPSDTNDPNVARTSVDSAAGSENTGPDMTIGQNGSVPKQQLGDVEIITFDDLNIGMPVDAKFRPLMLQYNDGRVNDLLGKRVNVAGYMNATDTLKGVKEFILLRNLECKFGPGGQADHLVHVLLQGDVDTEFTDEVVYVEGVLELNEFPKDGPATWSIYDLQATKVSTRPPPRRRR